ncbi:MAG: acyl-CoA dehydrogenase family protein [Chloroflexi bacterium]|nr:acyl-CoA dehydrogenase family protein [Chloroflexota bacterium]
MDFTFTPGQEALRQEIRQYLAGELTPEFRNARYEVAGVGVSREFSRKLGQKGWIGLAWPREYGGKALGYIEFLVYREEMVMAGAPIAYHLTAENQMAPSIMQSGSEEQKRWFIPRIAGGEMSICIGYSEPGTGSDLASLETRAARDGDDFVINGVKTWNSGARHSQFVWLAARTNADVPKHRGITVFLVDMGLPGITVRPIVNMAGIEGFSAITFEDVRVPKGAVVGEVDRGWYVAAQNLDYERSGIERVAGNYPVLRDFVALIKEARHNGEAIASRPEVRSRVAQMFIELEVGRLLAYKIAWMQSQGQVPNKEASVSKLFGAETTQRNARAMLEIMGLYGQLAEGSPHAPLQGRLLRAWYGGVSATIAAGTSEIQRNIIAQRGLDLPRG